MGKKSKGSKAGEGASDEASLPDDAAMPDDPWGAAWNSTMESSAAARAKGFEAVCALLRSGFPLAKVQETEGRFVDAAVSALMAKRSDRQAEAVVARMLSLVFVTLGRGCQAALDAVAGPLQDRCREGKARGACIQAYAIGAFSAGGTDHDRLAALRFLAGLWITERGADLVAALRGWALVMATVDVRTISTPLIDATLRHLSTHLMGKTVAVRNAASVALGLLYQMCGLEVLPDDDDELLDGDGSGSGSDTGATASGQGGASLNGSSCAVSEDARGALESGFQGILSRMEDLACNRGDASRLNRTERKSSRQSAAGVLAAISADGGPVRVERFRFRSGVAVTFDTLQARVIRDALVETLGGAFQAHMERNPLMEEVFALDDDVQEVLSKGEKQQWRQDASKAGRNVQRSKHKASSARMAAHMLGEG